MTIEGKAETKDHIMAAYLHFRFRSSWVFLFVLRDDVNHLIVYEDNDSTIFSTLKEKRKALYKILYIL